MAWLQRGHARRLGRPAYHQGAARIPEGQGHRGDRPSGHGHAGRAVALIAVRAAPAPGAAGAWPARARRGLRAASPFQLRTAAVCRTAAVRHAPPPAAPGLACAALSLRTAAHRARRARRSPFHAPVPPPFWSSWLPWSKPPPAFSTPSPSSAPATLRTADASFLQPAELRIDVDPPAATIEDELAALHGRLHTPGDRLHGIASIPLMDDPDLLVRYREADGERYVYVEGPAPRLPAGTTVFNRLIELNRRADRHLRAPPFPLCPGLPAPRPGHRRVPLGTGRRAMPDDRRTPVAGRPCPVGPAGLRIPERLCTREGQGAGLPRRRSADRMLDDLHTRRFLLAGAGRWSACARPPAWADPAPPVRRQGALLAVRMQVQACAVSPRKWSSMWK